ncbi:hypothetical protein [Aquimarina sp. AU474]|uniref:hypothetical protein n=1 Tax=Aquimarina sp. AU474 TaxID=2108529 RepID=UPI0013588539|nr:hypothetical protein [Aquimarina sp. AU474]
MAKNKGLGCFQFSAIVLTSVVLSSFVKSLLMISTLTAFGFLLLSISMIYGRIEHKKTKKNAWKYVLYSLLLLISLVGVKAVLNNLPTYQENEVKSNISEDIYRETIFEKGDSIVLLSQQREWKDNYGNSFEGNFSVREQDYTISKKEYFDNRSKHRKFSWGNLYQSLAVADTPRLDLILKKLEEIQASQTLNRFEFADMVVTFIQDIPYALVFESHCESPEKYEPSIRSILERCPDCCIGGIPYGIQNPVGFMGNLKGDCDTRTVIIYAILSHFGYNVAILNSDYYKHSILGLEIPAKGTYKLHNGKRYYVWETTNKHFTIGTLPRSFNNINHWHIMLTNTQHHAN